MKRLLIHKAIGSYDGRPGHPYDGYIDDDTKADISRALNEAMAVKNPDVNSRVVENLAGAMNRFELKTGAFATSRARRWCAANDVGEQVTPWA